MSTDHTTPWTAPDVERPTGSLVAPEVEMLPEMSARADFRAQMELAMSSMRGLAMHQAVDTRRNISRAWGLVREQLLTLAAE